MRVMVTGGTGFFGGILKSNLRQAGWDVVNLDLLRDPQDEALGKMVVADLRDEDAIEAAFRDFGPFNAVCHLAAELAHGGRDPQALWQVNVNGTRNIAEACVRHGVGKLIFTSTNCLWGRPLNRPVVETDVPCPVEVYGRSKLAAEQLLHDYEKSLQVVIFRSSTIIAPGRIGLLSILFDFIAEGRRLPVVGRKNRPYQFIAASDYSDAVSKALAYDKSDVFHVGSHHATSLEQSYAEVIRSSGSSSKIYHLPEFPALELMRLFYTLKLSPLGPYQYGMIAEEFVFDTSHVEQVLGWQPTRTNGEILRAAYEYYVAHKQELAATDDSLSVHRRNSRMGIIRLLKWIS